MPQVDARLALIRHAVAGGADPPRISPLQRRASVAAKMSAAVEAAYPTTDDALEEYAYCFDERVSVHVYEGLPERCGSKTYHGGECCARHLALGDLGCLEFWAYPKLEACRVRVPAPASAGLCSRCESVGHVVERCPFSVGDVDVMKVARYRRELRARREAAA